MLARRRVKRVVERAVGERARIAVVIDQARA